MSIISIYPRGFIMGKDKLRKFAEVDTFKNVHQLEDGKEYKGNWAIKHFKNDLPIVLELACGKGEYSVNMAKHFPNKNFIGVDSKGNRIWRGAKTALEEGIDNVAFLRIQIEHILDYFEKDEISEIWITFPDPQPQLSREKKRLTFPSFLERYQVILKPMGIMHLKTDNDQLHDYTAGILKTLNHPILAKTEDLYHSDILDEILQIKTFYEKKYLAVGKNINYIKWSFELQQ